ncbi:MAG TPA: tetratricopeptide repeat protein [Verrucomicrobiae bacterium]|jgi:tetratricopeptide (TPR) repeat protein|nr:tetratricopeptide repeat protein [Verrucomicrobiae bacterium]
MINTKRLAAVLCVLALVLCCGSGCTRKSRLARLTRQADADFAAEHYENAEIEYSDLIRARMDPHSLGQLGIIYSREGRPQIAFACLKKSNDLSPKDPQVKTALALVYAALRHFPEAFNEAKEVLVLQPTNGEAMTVLSETALAPKDVQQAQSLLRALPSQPDRFPEYHVALATLDVRLHDTTAAEAELRQALARDPKSPEAHFRLSQVYFQRTNIVEATNEIKTAAADASWRSPIRLKGVDLQLQTEGPDAARKSLLEITSHAPYFISAWEALMRLDFAAKKLDDCKKTVATILSKDPYNLDASLENGLIALAQGNNAEAATALEKLETREPNSPEIKYYLGMTALTQGEQGKARQYLNTALRLNTNYAQASLVLAQLDMRTQNAGAAVPRLERLIAQQPTLPEPRLLLAEAYAMQQEPQRALAIYRQLTQMRPDDARMPYYLGVALAQNNDLTGAAKAFAKSLELSPDFQPALNRLVEAEVAAKHFDAAQDIVQKRLDKNPKAGNLYLLRSAIYRAQDNNAKAEEALHQAIAVEPDLVQAYVSLAALDLANHKEQEALDQLNSVVSHTNDISALMSLGALQQQMGHYEAARDAYEKLLTVNPRFPAALNNLAYLYSENLNDLDKAYTDAQKARTLRPLDPYCGDTLGWILYKRGDYPRALALLREAAEGEPGDPEVQYHLGMTYYTLGEEAPARLALQNTVSSLTPTPVKADAQRRLAILAINPQNADNKTVETLEQALKSDPHDSIAVARLAAVYEARGSFDQAAQSYEQALKANPKNAALMGHLAALYADHLHRADDALKLARAAHDLNGDDPLACYVLGRLSYDKGDYSYAVAILEKAAAPDNASPEASAALAVAYYAVGKVSEAAGAMQRALAATPAGPEHEADSQFLTLVGACSSFASAKSALPQASAVLAKDAHFLPAMMVRALAAEADGDAKGALQDNDAIVALYPQFAPALRQSAILAARLGDDDKAAALADKARPSYPSDPELAKILGRAAYRHGDFSRSAQYLAAAENGSDAESLYYLGMDYYKLKRNSQSKRALDKALSLNLASNLAADAKRALGEMK